MRHIDTSTCAISNQWRAQALAADGECNGVPHDQRHDVFRRRGNVWSDLKPTLSRLSYAKCWYCESKDERSDNNVDHYRPKAQVAECLSHPGYWWLAFEWTNYRFACTFCNSKRLSDSGEGGKHDHFPLFDEARRAHTRGASLSAEDPVLLDPTNAADPLVLWFEPDGSAVPRYSASADARRNRKATDSIRHYHLNHPATTERRQQIALRIEALVRRCDDLLMDSDQTSADRTIGALVEELQRFLRSDAPFSAAARATLRNHRYREWVEAVLNTT